MKLIPMVKRGRRVSAPIALVSGLLGLFAGAAGAVEDTALTFRGGPKTGTTLYSIGGKNETNVDTTYWWMPVSELRFPLNVQMVNARYDTGFGARSGFFAEAAVNINGNAGITTDSDWLTGPGVLNVYSESRADATLLEGRLGMTTPLVGANRFVPSGLKVGVELDVRYYYFEMFDTVQTSNVPAIATTGKAYGLAMTYRALYLMPFFHLDYESPAWEDFYVKIATAVAPLSFVDDRDEHLLRDLYILGQSKGVAMKCALAGMYKYSQEFDMTLEIDYMEYLGAGTQHKDFSVPKNGVRWSNQDLRHRMWQYNAMIGARYHF